MSSGIIIAIFIILSIIIGFLLFCMYRYYKRKEAVRRHKDIYEKIGYDLTRILSWFFSVEGLLVILIGVIIACLYHVCFCEKEYKNLELLSFTLNISLATLIPTIISRIIAKNHLNEIIEEKIEKELNNFTSSLYNIRRDKGHSCRMSAVLLYQNAMERNNRKVENAIWSIGWASEAITQYLLIKENYTHAQERCIDCMEIIINSYNIIKKPNGNKEIEIKQRDMISVLTMYSLLKYFCYVELVEKAIYKKSEERICVKDIVKTFYSTYKNNCKNKITGHQCRITGMNENFNRNIEAEAEIVINDLESQA